MMLLWPLLIIGLIYLFYREDISFPRQQNPKNILDERLANGDITTQEYETLKQTLEE
ncbi:MAG: SHOCT domain-containing protein [Candidatus Izimaplasma sp.]|nr:SHOCT domain-containing protein [Candidatus Izimaplasma bacterium]